MTHTANTQIFINDTEFQCEFIFDYQAKEPASFGFGNSNASPGRDEEVQILSASIFLKDHSIQLFTREYDWLLTDDIIKNLEQDALKHMKEFKNNSILEFCF